jgi:hypothetical protein
MPQIDSFAPGGKALRMGEVRRAAKARVLTSFSASLLALAAAVVIGVIGGQVSPLPERVVSADDSYTLTASPESVSGKAGFIAAGGLDGGAAISYLKFDVDLPKGKLPKRSWLWLRSHADKLPAMVELTHVPDVLWSEETLTADTAPRLGQVISSVMPEPAAPAVAFDITSVIKGSGLYAFAVTSPSGLEHALFVARELGLPAIGAPTITFDWWFETAAPTRTVPIAPPGFTPTPRPTRPPITNPWPSASPSVSASASVSVSPSASPSPTGPPWSPDPSPPWSPSPSVEPTPSPSLEPTPSPSLSPSESPSPSGPPSVGPSLSPSLSVSPSKPGSPTPSTGPKECVVGDRLVPTCGALWGVAPGAHTSKDRIEALKEFDALAKKPQLIYHAYHRGQELFPTAAEIAAARNPDNPRLLFLNWKPLGVTWAEIADSDSSTDTYLDKLAAHIKKNFPEQFFFTMHHEPENEVRAKSGSGMTAKDYAAAFRYVVKYLRAKGVSNVVTTMCYMAYIPWNTQPWFEDLYPGDDVIDWVSWDIYAYSDPGYGFGDFSEMMNRRSGSRPGWPGFYNWAATTFPSKPLMVAEWGVWYSRENKGHQAKFFDSARLQLELFPRVKAYVYFETPNAEGRDSRIHNTSAGQRAFQKLSDHPAFNVILRRPREAGLL